MPGLGLQHFQQSLVGGLGQSYLVGSDVDLRVACDIKQVSQDVDLFGQVRIPAGDASCQFCRGFPAYHGKIEWIQGVGGHVENGDDCAAWVAQQLVVIQAADPLDGSFDDDAVTPAPDTLETVPPRCECLPNTRDGAIKHCQDRQVAQDEPQHYDGRRWEEIDLQLERKEHLPGTRHQKFPLDDPGRRRAKHQRVQSLAVYAYENEEDLSLI